MQADGSNLSLSPTDLSQFLSCNHLTALALKVERGDLEKPQRYSPVTEALREKGNAHEQAYLAHLKTRYALVAELGERPSKEQTLAAMRSGADVIFQARLAHGQWGGYADFLIKVDKPSDLGDWSYEAQDTKLARETKAGTILQLCVYTELLAAMQGARPDHMHVVPPGRDWQPETYRVDDYLAYHRLVSQQVVDFIAAPSETYPEPVSHCDYCDWWATCEKRRRADDHLSYVADIAKGQIETLRANGIATLTAFANAIELPKPERGSIDALANAQHQAQVQVQGKALARPHIEIKTPIDDEHGFQRLPAPTPDDIFLDFEGSHFAEDGVQEYLTGWVTVNADGSYAYHPLWADTEAAEKAAFETFIDTVMAMRKKNPQGHVYHFAPYEQAALKRLMGRYATRERELDILLIEGVLVDLHSVVKRSLYASVESYSIKNLEEFFGYARSQDLREASASRRLIELALEDGPLDAAMTPHKAIVEAYNREDCESTHRLQQWLEALRAAEEASSGPIPRLSRREEAPEPKDLDRELQALRDALIKDIPIDRDERNDEQQARFLLGHMMEFHRREDKASWWEYFRLRDLLPEDIFRERKAITGLQEVEVVNDKKAPIVRFSFPPQDVDARDDEDVHIGDEGAEKTQVAHVVAVDHHANTIDLQLKTAQRELRPSEVFLYSNIGTDVIRQSLMALGNHVLSAGLTPTPPYTAALRLLTRAVRDVTDGAMQRPDEDGVAAACRLALALDGDVLAIQGPPGTGKTHTGAQLICELVKAGKKVGVVAVGHKVIHNLLEKVTATAAEHRMDACVAHRPGSNGKYEGTAPIENVQDYDKVLAGLASGEIKVLGGTQWMWAKPEFIQSVDVLVVDEAGQMALANVLASAPAANSVILLGDPQQLEQPIQSSHPVDSDVAALKHWLGEHDTMPAERGLFLAETWRLHPDICAFTSEIYYEGKLKSKAKCAQQSVVGEGLLHGSGLRYLPVNHQGRTARADEEVHAIKTLVAQVERGGLTWVNMAGEQAALTLDDLLIVAPYNAQVAALKAAMPKLAHRIGTVDKFQGQEAAVVIYSMTSSSPDDAPRGMEFLYNANRFNVATSRARALCVLVGEPRLLAPVCKTPKQMKMANGFCRFGEMVNERDN